MSAFSTRVERDGEVVRIRIGGTAVEGDRETADRVRSAIGDALAGRRAFRRTVEERRPDGSYAVSKRGADSPGNRAVFDSFAALRGLYGRLPDRFDADDVGAAGAAVTGSRRHLVPRHLAEHPAFGCGLASRNRLVGEKEPRNPAGERRE